jgi:acetolactate synthase-1/2/3 large subunit
MNDQIGINLSVARSCFVRCDGCYNHFGRVDTLVDTDTIIAFLDRVRCAGVEKVTVCGGDPLARPDILPLLEKIRALGFVINLDTVGTPLLRPATTVYYGRRAIPRVDPDRLARLVDLIGIPVDGPSNATVAEFRVGRANLLDEQLRIIAGLDSVNARVCVNTVVHRRNLGEIRCILPLISQYRCVVKWQLFQFSPTGPLGFRNRDAYVIDERPFLALDAGLRADAAARYWPAEIELKTNARRKDHYLLIDSEGLAWTPYSPTGGTWDPVTDATDHRVIIGDIKLAGDHPQILDAVLRLRRSRCLPALAGQPRQRKEERSMSRSMSDQATQPLRPVARVMTGAEAIAEALRRWGCSTVFAYPGTSELALCAAIAECDEVSLVNARGDKEAAFMAAGGNLHGQPACVAILHGARGLTNALGAVADVRRSEVPVLYLVGMPSRSSARYLPPHGEPALIDAAGSFAKAAFDCSTLDSLDARAFLKLVADALRTLAEAPLGPVLLGLPHDVLTNRFVPAEVLADALPDTPCPQEPEVAEALALLRDAQRPVVLVDDYLLRAPMAESDLGAFATALAAPVLEVAYQRGPMLFQQVRTEAVPTSVGPYDPTNSEHRRLLGSADVLITVEDRNMYPRVVGPLPACRKIALTSNIAATAKNGYLASSDVLVSGDVCRAMRRITEQLACSEANPRRRPWSVLAPTDPGCHDSAVELVRAVARGLPAVLHPVVVDDSQMFGGLLARNYQYLPDTVKVFGSHGGFVGGGLATAVGLATAHPELHVLSTLGDQGFTNGVQALAAASEHQVPLLILVCNNGSSVSLRKQADFDGLGDGGLPALSNVAQMSYAAIATGFGLSAALHVWPDNTPWSEAIGVASRELTAEIKRAITARRPHLIELVTPSSPEFWAGVWRVEGLEAAARPKAGTGL